MDLRNQKQMFDYRIDSALDAGLTPYEAYLGPAGGAGGGTTGSGQVLGNSAAQQSMRTQELNQQNEIARRENAADRAVDLMKTSMQTNAQRDVAEMQTGATTRGQDIQKQIADDLRTLDRERIGMEKQRLAADLDIKAQELEIKINEVVTSSAKFKTAMKQLSMGPANLLVELTLRDEGISLSDGSFEALPESRRKKILDKIVALSSRSYTEVAGAGTAGAELMNRWNQILNDVLSIFGLSVGNGIEATPDPVPNLGNPPTSRGSGARSSGGASPRPRPLAR